jgi:hypothetical protein
MSIGTDNVVIESRYSLAASTPHPLHTQGCRFFHVVNTDIAAFGVVQPVGLCELKWTGQIVPRPRGMIFPVSILQSLACQQAMVACVSPPSRDKIAVWRKAFNSRNTAFQ